MDDAGTVVVIGRAQGNIVRRAALVEVERAAAADNGDIGGRGPGVDRDQAHESLIAERIGAERDLDSFAKLESAAVLDQRQPRPRLRAALEADAPEFIRPDDAVRGRPGGKDDVGGPGVAFIAHAASAQHSAVHHAAVVGPQDGPVVDRDVGRGGPGVDRGGTGPAPQYRALEFVRSKRNSGAPCGNEAAVLDDAGRGRVSDIHAAARFDGRVRRRRAVGNIEPASAFDRQAVRLAAGNGDLLAAAGPGEDSVGSQNDIEGRAALRVDPGHGCAGVDHQTPAGIERDPGRGSAVFDRQLAEAVHGGVAYRAAGGDPYAGGTVHDRILRRAAVGDIHAAPVAVQNRAGRGTAADIHGRGGVHARPERGGPGVDRDRIARQDHEIAEHVGRERGAPVGVDADVSAVFHDARDDRATADAQGAAAVHHGRAAPGSVVAEVQPSALVHDVVVRRGGINAHIAEAVHGRVADDAARGDDHGTGAVHRRAVHRRAAENARPGAAVQGRFVRDAAFADVHIAVVHRRVGRRAAAADVHGVVVGKTQAAEHIAGFAWDVVSGVGHVFLRSG